LCQFCALKRLEALEKAGDSIALVLDARRGTFREPRYQTKSIVTLKGVAQAHCLLAIAAVLDGASRDTRRGLAVWIVKPCGTG
jgi:hypothetical protein